MGIVFHLPDAGRILHQKFIPLTAESMFQFNLNPTQDFMTNGVVANDEFVSTVDGPPVVKSFRNMTIQAGHTVRPTNRCKGMYLYIAGDLTINGTLSMTLRGAKGPGKYVGMDAKNGRIYYHPTDIFTSVGLPFITPNGGAITAYPPYDYCVDGNPGTGGACGGGGSGGRHAVQPGTANAGRGGNGTSFSGGAGGGGVSVRGGATTSGTDGEADGGAGGIGYGHNPSPYVKSGGGGAGNPGGAGRGNGGGYGPGASGTGGLIILIVKGKIILGPNGKIEAAGGAGGYAQPSWTWNMAWGSGGGGSGGGAIHLFTNQTLTTADQAKLLVPGGLGYVSDVRGGNGGAGSKIIRTIPK
jgi:hypothetical protein